MKESDYILATDKARVMAMIDLLRNIQPGTRHIPDTEMMRVARLLKLWDKRIFVHMGSGDEKDKRELAEWELAWMDEKGERPPLAPPPHNG